VQRRMHIDLPNDELDLPRRRAVERWPDNQPDQSAQALDPGRQAGRATLLVQQLQQM